MTQEEVKMRDNLMIKIAPMRLNGKEMNEPVVLDEDNNPIHSEIELDTPEPHVRHKDPPIIIEDTEMEVNVAIKDVPMIDLTHFDDVVVVPTHYDEIITTPVDIVWTPHTDSIIDLTKVWTTGKIKRGMKNDFIIID
jgi:hypothetical protein